MQRVTRDKLAVVFDRRLPPVATVKPGEVFVVETDDCRTGATRTPETTTPEFLLAMRERGWHGNPVTGPIYVEGAEPGDALAVTIHDIACDDLGFMPYWPFLFHMEDFFDLPRTELVEIRDGHVHLDGVPPIPVRPMIGTIGVAPALEAIASGGMGAHAGNLDAEEVRAGSTIHLPVFVPGALLALGDAHAVQSDGELGSVEMRSVVTLSCEVIKGRGKKLPCPRIVTADEIVAVGLGRPLEEALRSALRAMILWLEADYGLSKHQAYLLIGAAGHARPGQSQVGLFSMRCIVPKAFLPRAKSPG
jgi:amidase